ncbi:MAG: BatA domain-containing protein [Acidobacteria bacterium]|nr:BatA domain-containing protein [Acidobacteriota bacterium]
MFGLSFLAPAFLAGGLAALLPLVLHLRRRDHLPRISFSDLRFLRGAPVEQARRRRLREWLLLALRMLALCLLAFAFARPFLSDPVAISASQSATVVLVDTSMSMSSPGQVARTRALAREAVDNAPEDHLVGVMTFDDRVQLAAALGDRVAARAAVERLEPGLRGTRYATGLAGASALLGARSGRVVVVTDLQEGGWDAGDARVSPTVDVVVRDVGGPSGNLGVLSLESAPGETVAVVLRSGVVDEDTTAELAVDGEVLAAVALAPEPGQTVVHFPVVLPVAGVATVSVADGVGYEADNRRYRLLDPPDPVRLLLVADERVPRDEDAVFYLERAFGSETGVGAFVPHVVRADDLAASADLDGPDRVGAVVLTGARGLGRAGRERLAAFVRGGGGLLVVGGDTLGPLSLNALFAGEPDLGLGEPLTHGEPVRLVAQAPRHPIMRGLGSLAGALGQTRFRRTRPLTAGDGQVLAQFGDGRPALVEHTVGAGRMLVFGADLGATWSDLPRRVVFVPLLHETLGYLASSAPQPREFIVGEQPAHVPDQPGAATSADGARRLVVNVDPAESDATAISAEVFSQSIRALAGDGGQIPDAAAAPESGERLWRVFLLGMALVLVAEALLSRRMA